MSKVAEFSINVEKLEKTMAEKVRQFEQALPKMAESIKITAVMKAPKRLGPLRESVKVENSKRLSEISFGNNGRIPYARYQEYGNPAWHFTTPGTGPKYLRNATEAAARKGIQAFI